MSKTIVTARDPAIREQVAVASRALGHEDLGGFGLGHEGVIFVPPDIVRFTKTGDLILTRELGQALAQTLGARNAALMVHHGIVTAGASVEAAVVAAILLERACRKQLLAMAAGELRTWSSDEEALSKRSRVYSPELIYTYLIRKAQTSHGGGAV